MPARDAKGRFIRPLSKHTRIADLTNQPFGLLTVIRFAGREKLKNGIRALWLCRCSCGKRSVVSTARLKSKNTRSCGCLRDKEATKRCKERITHGYSVRDDRGHVSPEYTAYCSARQRCRDPHVRRWKQYGGATPPVQFLYKNFQEFLDEVGPKPVVEGVRYSLGRVADKGHYGPNLGNCWMTDSGQIAERYKKRNGCYTDQQFAKQKKAA